MPTPACPFFISLGFPTFKDFFDIYDMIAPVISTSLISSLELILPSCYQ